MEQARADERAQELVEEQMRNEIAALVGCEGITVSDLRTCGTADINGRIISVRAHSGFIESCTKTILRRIDGATPVVEPVGVMVSDKGRAS